MWDPRLEGPFSLGLMPYLRASIWVLLASGLIGGWRALRDGAPVERDRFDRLILGSAVVVAGVDALRYYNIHQMVSREGFMGIEPIAFPASIVVLVQLGMFVLMLLAAIHLSRAGVGNGAALLATLPAFALDLPYAARSSYQVIERAGNTAGLFALCTILATLALITAFLRARRDLRLVSIGSDPGSPGRAVELPLRLNLVGATPLVLLAGPQAMLGGVLEDLSRTDPRALGWIEFLSHWGWILQSLAIVAITFVLTSLWYDTRQVGPLLARWGYRMEAAGEMPGERVLDRLLERRMLLSCAVLLALHFLPMEAIQRWTGVIMPPVLGGATLLVLGAVVMDTARHLGALRSMDRPAESDAPAVEPVAGVASDERLGSAPASEDEWATVLEPETELEARLAAAVLESHRIRAVVLANRASSLLGTLAVWEWCPPTYRAWTIYRRLGGGRVAVMVPTTDAARARAIVEARFSSPASEGDTSETAQAAG